MDSKYYLQKEVTIKIDRKIGSKHPKWGFVYPINYGFVPDTINADGEELDAYLLGVFKEYDDKQIRALTEFQERYFESVIWRR